MRNRFINGSFCLIASMIPALAAAEPSASADEIAKELANPNTALATLNFKNQFRWFDGDLPNADGQFSYTMLFQPVFPFPLANGDQILFRPALPLILDQPVYNPARLDFDSESGIGDLVFDLVYAGSGDNGLIWAAGLVATVPTASRSVLGSGNVAVGPEILLGRITEKYVYGVLPSHQWDVAGWGDSQTNISSAQVFATYLPGGGWNVGTSPILSYNWASGEWTIPLNLSFGKTVMWGDTPWKISAEINYYVERPDAFGPKWMVGLNFAPVVENVMAGWFE